MKKARHHPVLSLTLFTLPLLVCLLASCVSEPTEDSRDPIQLAWRLMWDPADPDLPDWQVLGRWPQDLVAGPADRAHLRDTRDHAARPGTG